MKKQQEAAIKKEKVVTFSRLHVYAVSFQTGWRRQFEDEQGEGQTEGDDVDCWFSELPIKSYIYSDTNEMSSP